MEPVLHCLRIASSFDHFVFPVTDLLRTGNYGNLNVRRLPPTTARTGGETPLAPPRDNLWYKDAVIYQLHVRTFCDSNGDGIGDFQGLTQRLDYLQELGTTAIWLLPFYPSPLRDDGYDIADYTSVHSSYGTLEDFKAFLNAAHSRGIQVIIELVVNHTSDQHPWFKEARSSRDNPKRDWYVWSDTDTKYKGVPIVFVDLTASVGDYRCCQVYLGEKSTPPQVTAADIVEVLRQTVGALFWCLESMESFWLQHDHTPNVPTFGPAHQLTSEPTEMDRHRIYEMFRSGVTDLEPILSSILDPETHTEIKSILAVEEGKFRYKSDLWVRTLYDFAASYHHSVITRDHLVQALAPLYRGMTYSFLVEHADSSPAEIEAANEMLCGEFELQKPYLRDRWKARVEVKS